MAPSDGLRTGPDLEGASLAISPDGESIAFAGFLEGEFYLFIRELSGQEARLIPGTENARAPFFSPDGQWIGFASSSNLKKVSDRGGSVITLSSSVRVWAGGSWGEDGTILFGAVSGEKTGLWRISADGGEAEQLTQATSSHAMPHVLPGGKSALFFNGDTRTIDLLDLESREYRPLLQEGSVPVFSPTGHLLYTNDGRLLAAPFDSDSGTFKGPAVPVVENLARGINTGRSHFALSQSGTLVVLPQWAVGTVKSLVWTEPSGGLQALENAPPAIYMDPRLSPQGDRLAMNLPSTGGEVWVRDLTRGTQMRVTNNPGDDETPVWSPDGRWIVFASGGGSPHAGRTLQKIRADGTGRPEALWTSEHHVHASDWSRDGKQLSVEVSDPETNFDIWVLAMEGEVEARPLLNGPSKEALSRLSPDGRWLAFVSDQSGRFEVYVQPYPGLESKSQISTDGGTEPVWSRAGTRRFYLSGRRMMAVEIAPGEVINPGRPEALFESRFGYARGALHFGYDVATDGRFLMPWREGDFFPSTLRLTLNWFDDLRRLVPTDQ